MKKEKKGKGQTKQNDSPSQEEQASELPGSSESVTLEETTVLETTRSPSMETLETIENGSKR